MTHGNITRAAAIRFSFWCTVAVFDGGMTSRLEAEVLGPTVREFCDPADPQHRCDEPRACPCLDGRIAIEFDAAQSSVLELSRFEAGLPVETTLALDAPDELVQGWSFGVRHDSRFLTLESLTMEGADALAHAPCAFRVLSMRSIEECVAGDLRCASPTEGSGYIAAFVIISDGHFIPAGRTTLHRAIYRLTDEVPGPRGTLIELTERLKQKGSPSVDINVTVAGWSRQPRWLVDGLIRPPAVGGLFHRGDPTGDGNVTVGDAIATLLYLLRGGGPPACIEAADFDDDGRLQLTDAVQALRWLFLGGRAPAFPGPPGDPCGPDAANSPAQLGCAEYSGC